MMQDAHAGCSLIHAISAPKSQVNLLRSLLFITLVVSALIAHVAPMVAFRVLKTVAFCRSSIFS